MSVVKVEDAVLEHDGVAGTAAIGVPDAMRGQDAARAINRRVSGVNRSPEE